MALLLTDAELEELTGFTRHSAQVRALRQMGIDHYVRPDGKPCVLESMLKDSIEKEKLIEPNWDAMNA
jgi:hypothetical protein